MKTGKGGVILDPWLPEYPLEYLTLKKVSHHLLGHFERKLPVYLSEAESDYFAVAALRVPFITLHCMYGVPLQALFTSEKEIKKILTKRYSLEEKLNLL